ncbi:EAL domain-containing protein [Alteromonas sp. ASW11-130]|uniref:EAL domain-containing protein n=1 Tax=Alteromonas sp. ASW11-130 TaxID=3015775 RepID=UPI002242AB48|nr:EAL domain-containing protein [Alteromonas sp. ASW11-130]
MRFGNVNQEDLHKNITAKEQEPLPCAACRQGTTFEKNFSMAFQPLVDLSSRETYGYEALVRGMNGEPAATVINEVTAENIYQFDQTCRVKAIALAAQHNLTKKLSINFLPGAIHRPDACIKTTLAAAKKYDFPISRLNFEMVETDHVPEIHRLEETIDYYRKIGFNTALDDFGSGYANLDWLAYLNPDSIKIDISLIRNIDKVTKRRLIVSHLQRLASTLNVEVVAEGVETKAERDVLAEMGVTKQQGFYFAKPQFEEFIAVPEEVFK